MNKLKNQHVLISKVNQIGDVTFALPIASVLKKIEPSCRISFLGRGYTQALINSYQHVDSVVNWDMLSGSSTSESSAQQAIKHLKSLNIDIILHVHPHQKVATLAKMAKIPIRLGTIRRVFHWNTCNRFVYLTRKKSVIHEVQYDFRILRYFGVRQDYSL